MALALMMLSAAALSPFTDRTSPIWAPAGQQAKHVLLRPPTMRFATTPAKMTIAVSAAPDIKNGGKVLALYDKLKAKMSKPDYAARCPAAIALKER